MSFLFTFSRESNKGTIGPPYLWVWSLQVWLNTGAKNLSLEGFKELLDTTRSVFQSHPVGVLRHGASALSFLKSQNVPPEVPWRWSQEAFWALEGFPHLRTPLDMTKALLLSPGSPCGFPCRFHYPWISVSMEGRYGYQGPTLNSVRRTAYINVNGENCTYARGLCMYNTRVDMDLWSRNHEHELRLRAQYADFSV